MSQEGFFLSRISPREDSRHVRWHDSSDFKDKYEELSLRVSKVLGTDRSLKAAELDEDLQRSVRRLEKVKESSAKLREEALMSSRGTSDPNKVVLSEARPKFIDSDEENFSFSVRQKQKAIKHLTASDVISNPEVIDFIENHFRGKTKIKTEDFVASLEFEFPDLLDSSRLKEDLADVLSLDAEKEHISLNALEIFTRDKGLQRSINELAESSIKRELTDKTELNQAILEELLQLKEMLEARSEEQAAKEEELVNWEKQLEEREARLFEQIAIEVEELYKQNALKLKQESSVQFKRLSVLERSVGDQLKMIKAKQQLIASKEQASLKTSHSEPLSAKSKARIQSLEKTNEVLKGKVAGFEREVSQAKQAISKLTDELTRAKARSAMFEQSISELRQRPVEIPDAPKEIQPVAAEDHDKKPSGEIQLCLKTLQNLLSCLRLTLPLYCQPTKLHSPSASVMSFKSTLTAVDEVKGFLGEILYPSFNGMVCDFVELLPFVFKSKKSDIQLTVLWTFWDVVAFTYAEETRPEGDQQFLPQCLEFKATTDLWKTKLQKTRPNGQPLYQLFENLAVHKILSTYLQKFIEAKKSQAESRKDSMFISLAACFLSLLLSGSKKQILGALSLLKSWTNEAEQDRTVIEVVLSDLKGSVAVLIGLVTKGDADVKVAASELMLCFSVTYQEMLIHQLQHGESAKRLCDAVAGAIIEGQIERTKSELEVNLVILLEKVSHDIEIQSVLRETDLSRVMIARAQELPEETFYVSNLKAIVQRIQE